MRPVGDVWDWEWSGMLGERFSALATLLDPFWDFLMIEGETDCLRLELCDIAITETFEVRTL